MDLGPDLRTQLQCTLSRDGIVFAIEMAGRGFLIRHGIWDCSFPVWQNTLRGILPKRLAIIHIAETHGRRSSTILYTEALSQKIGWDRLSFAAVRLRSRFSRRCFVSLCLFGGWNHTILSMHMFRIGDI